MRKVARDGQHSENDTMLSVKVRPSSPIRACTRGSTRIDSSVWSSVMITTMLGCPASGVVPSSSRVTTTTMAAAATAAAAATTRAVRRLRSI